MRGPLSESKAARWGVLALVAVIMVSACFFTDIMAPLKPMLESELGWRSDDYGLFTSAYGWLNIFFFMLIFSGIILDRKGIRFTGTLSALIMMTGAGIKCWAISSTFPESARIFGVKSQVIFAALGFAIFGVGTEANFITFSKIIVKWFKGKELALAMGLQVCMVRIGIILSMVIPIPMVKAFGSISAPLVFCFILICAGFLLYLVYIAADLRLEKERGAGTGADPSVTSTDPSVTSADPNEKFQLADIGFILKSRDFWIIAMLCLLFYSGVFPFLKYSVDLMINKFNVRPDLAGNIPGFMPVGTLLLTPLFGHLYDRRGRGAGMIVLGAALLMSIHVIFALTFVRAWIVAVFLMLVMGVSISLVPSALWPTVARLIPEKRLGTAFSLIFYMQNTGISATSFIIGKLLVKYCITGTNARGGSTYDYTLPMTVFAAIGALAVIASLILKAEERKKLSAGKL